MTKQVGRAEWIHDQIEKLLRPGGKILDIGCDHVPIIGNRPDTTYFDIKSYEEIEKAFVQGDCANLPFGDQEFDIAIMGELLEHLNEPVVAMKEALRVARVVLITVPNEHNWHLDHKPFTNESHKWLYTVGLMKYHLEQAGVQEDQRDILTLEYGGWAFILATINQEPGELPSTIFDNPEYWCGDLGYRAGVDGVGYRDFVVNYGKVAYIQSRLYRHPLENQNPKILEVGCAMGYIVRRLRAEGIDAWGLDISQYAIDHAPEEVKPYLQRGTSAKLPWADDEFDYVVSFATLEHLEGIDLFATIGELQRVGKRGLITVGFADDEDFDEDPTHVTKQPPGWWATQFGEGFEVITDRNDYWMQYAPEGSPTTEILEVSQEKFEELIEAGKIRTAPGALLDTPIPAPPLESSRLPLIEAKPVARQPGKLKIALTASPFIPVPPTGYGGLERVVYDIAVPLAQMGHEVTVFGAEGSEAEGCQVFSYGPPIGTVECDWLNEELQACMKSREVILAGGFDIIHTHDWFGFHYKFRVDHPELKICHTMHGHINPQWWCTSKAPFPVNMFALSNWMKGLQEQHGFMSKVVYNGIDMDKYAFKDTKGDRLLFVGRIDDFKRPHIAIEAAKKLGLGLDMCAGTFVFATDYMKQVKESCDGEQIIWHEEPTQEFKVQLIQDAKVLIAPSKMGEPFGLMLPEANSCGTPAIASNDGAMKEIIKEGVTGFIVPPDDCVDAICEAVKKCDQIDPHACRKHVEEHFSREIMASNYLAAYLRIVEGNEW